MTLQENICEGFVGSLGCGLQQERPPWLSWGNLKREDLGKPWIWLLLCQKRRGWGGLVHHLESRNKHYSLSKFQTFKMWQCRVANLLCRDFLRVSKHVLEEVAWTQIFLRSDAGQMRPILLNFATSVWTLWIQQACPNRNKGAAPIVCKPSVKAKIQLLGNEGPNFC